MSVLKFIWFAVLVLIVVQFVNAVNNEGSIPENFFGNILIFLALSVLIILGWLFRLILKQFAKKQDQKPKKAAKRGSTKKQTSQNAEPQPVTDDPLLSLLAEGDIYGDGVDADQIPDAIGEFGLDVNNPIPVKSVLGAIEYLDNLTFSDGSKVKYVRLGSTSSAHVKHSVDAYELSRESGEKVCTVYLSPYHKRNSRKKPDFQTEENKLSAEEDVVITNPFEPSVDVQTVDGTFLYISELSKLSHAELCVELSNVMSAKRNLMFSPTSISEYSGKQTLVTDLTDKALWICVNMFGQDVVSSFNQNNPSHLNELINALDKDVAQRDLKPEEHGACLLSKLGEILAPDKRSSDDSAPEPDSLGRHKVRFGQLPDHEIKNFQWARDIVFKRDIVSDEEHERLLEAREELNRLYLDGYGEAFSVLGYMGVVHAGDESDVIDGFKILRNCSAAGDRGSTCLLGDIYLLGLSVPHDFEKAWEYFTLAIDQGSVTALTSKGIMAIKGLGVQKDIDLGRRLLTSAHARGATTAKDWLDKLDSWSEEIPSENVGKAPMPTRAKEKENDFASRSSEIRAVAERLRIPHLVHFTRCENLESILRYGVHSIASCGELGLEAIRNDTLRLDNQPNGISVSIAFPNYRMFYKYRQLEMQTDWAVLILSPEILWEKECGFYKNNAASSHVRHRPRHLTTTAHAFLEMFEGGNLGRDAWLNSYDPTDSQAEVMVYDTIEPHFIEAIAFETKANADRWADHVEGIETFFVGRNKGLFATREHVRRSSSAEAENWEPFPDF
jgi:ssDNA thymidine ADP-ribosyltransferase, DarT